MGKEKLLTNTELEIMNILWSIGKSSVRDVMASLPGDRELAYTSVSTMLRILDKKSFVNSIKEGKTHYYEPAVEKADYESKETNHLVSNLFSGSGLSLVRCLIENEKISSEDLAEIQKMLEGTE